MSFHTVKVFVLVVPIVQMVGSFTVSLIFCFAVWLSCNDEYTVICLE